MISIGNILALISVTSLCSARLQYLTFFTGTSYTGDSLTIRSNHPNTSYFIDFVRNARSWRGLGFWHVSQFTNFGGGGIVLRDGLVERGSKNFSFPHDTGSIRHVGTLDMSLPAMWLYSNFHQSMVINEWNPDSQERIVAAPAANNFSFVPRSLVTTGSTNWTVFTGSNFDGISTCLVSTREIEVYAGLNSIEWKGMLSDIKSVIRGCLDKTDNYVYGGDRDGANHDPA